MIFDEFLNSYSSLVSATPWLAPLMALVSGIISSAICPCTMPMGLGIAGAIGASESTKAKSGFLLSFGFFSGIVLNLTILGALAGSLGGLLTETFGGYWALAMAVFSLGLAVFSFSQKKLGSLQLASFKSPGAIGAFFYGFMFSLGTSVAPLLLLMSIAAYQGNTVYGTIISMFFGIGRGLPFLLIGAFSPVVVRLAKLSSWQKSIRFVSGIGLLLVSSYYARIYAMYYSMK